MRDVLNDPRAALLHGDAIDLGQFIGRGFVDAIVTDPPAGIGFMGREWDGDRGGRDQWITWLAEILRAALVTLKPGGHALVWAIPRTSHWTAMALELAGFEVRDVHHHLFGTGFPKSLTSKSADIPEETGTALKPAVEHWILARKPLEGSIAENFAQHGTGVLNIDACRIGGRERTDYGLANSTRTQDVVFGAPSESADFDASKGRWPAHLSLDEYGAEILDAQTGILKGGEHPAKRAGLGYGSTALGTESVSRKTSAGGASKFFYIAKGTRAEKDAGLEHLAPRTGGEATGRKDGSAGTKNARAGAGRTGGARNHHPTVKSIALMRWLVRLITPPGGVVLDMFAGSGTTGVAAIAEGRSFIGIERDEAYIPILVARIQHALDAAT